MTTKTFKEAYDVLQGHAQTLREQQEPNIDDLLKIVTESVDAYQVCKERIDAVEKALDKALSDVGTAATREPARIGRQSPTPPPSDTPQEGDIPFD